MNDERYPPEIVEFNGEKYFWCKEMKNGQNVMCLPQKTLLTETGEEIFLKDKNGQYTLDKHKRKIPFSRCYIKLMT
jgi:hypothetical protein